MKKIIVFLTLSLLFLVSASPIQANEISKPQYYSGQVVTLDQTYYDDVFAFGGTIILEGTVSGDLLVAATTININGTVKGDLRVIGATVIISGNVEKNVSIVAANLHVTKDAKISGNLDVNAAQTIVSGLLEKNLTAKTTSATLSGKVLGKTEVYSNIINIQNTFETDGDFVYHSNYDATISENAEIKGQLSKITDLETQADINSKIIFKLFSFLSALIIGLAFIYLFPKESLEILKIFQKNQSRLMLRGLIFLLFIPFASILMAITLIGLPLAIITFGLYLLMLYFSRIFAAAFVGTMIIEAITKKASNLYKALFLGLASLELIIAVPITGYIVNFLFVILGFGVIISIINKKIMLSKKV